MITPEPPAGSEHYREGWRHGYEQAAIDRERSADAVRLVPVPGQARETARHREGPGAGWPRVAGRCPGCNRASLFLAAGEHVTCSHLDCPAPCAADDLLHPVAPSGDTVQAPDVAAFASEMVARTSMAPSKPLLPWPELPQDLAFLAVVIDRLRAGAELALQGVDQATADDIRRRAALLGTDTTPEARQ